MIGEKHKNELSSLGGQREIAYRKDTYLDLGYKKPNETVLK